MPTPEEGKSVEERARKAAGRLGHILCPFVDDAKPVRYRMSFCTRCGASLFYTLARPEKTQGEALERKCPGVI